MSRGPVDVECRLGIARRRPHRPAAREEHEGGEQAGRTAHASDRARMAGARREDGSVTAELRSPRPAKGGRRVCGLPFFSGVRLADHGNEGERASGDRMAGLVRRAADPLAAARRHDPEHGADRRARRCGDRRDGRRGRSLARAPELSRGVALGEADAEAACARHSGFLSRSEHDRAPAQGRLPRSGVPDGRGAYGRSRTASMGGTRGVVRAEHRRRRRRPAHRSRARPRPRAERAFGRGAVMNVWLWGATALLAGIVPCGWIALRASRADALVALELAGTVSTLALVLMSEGVNRVSYMTVPVALAFLSLVGALLSARFLGRHLCASTTSSSTRSCSW